MRGGECVHISEQFSAPPHDDDPLASVISVPPYLSVRVIIVERVLTMWITRNCLFRGHSMALSIYTCVFLNIKLRTLNSKQFFFSNDKLYITLLPQLFLRTKHVPFPFYIF